MTRPWRVWQYRIRAVFWGALGVAAFPLGWAESIVLVWIASVYANVSGDMGAAEAADDRRVLDAIAGLRTEITDLRRDVTDLRAQLDDLRAQLDDGVSRMHIGRSWVGTPLEDECPCPQQPCGLVSTADVDPACTEHPLGRGKSLRQAHMPRRCPGPPTPPDPPVVE